MVLAVAAELPTAAGTSKSAPIATCRRRTTNWLLGQLGCAKRELGLAAIAIDYVAPGQRALADANRAAHAADGLIPWVANPELDARRRQARGAAAARPGADRAPGGWRRFPPSTAQRFLWHAAQSPGLCV